MTAFDPTPLRPDAPAMPHACLTVNGVPLSPGLTARQHAAIALRVPDSGEEWLNAMIRTSLRDKFAGEALQGLLADSNVTAPREMIAKVSFDIADAMLAARGDAL